jgi:hypothetical protein
LTDDRPQSATIDQLVEAVGTFVAEQCSRAVPAGAAADQTRDDRRADRCAQRHEQPEHGPEQHTAASGQNWAGYEHGAEDGRHHDVGQRRNRTGGGHRASDALDIDDARDGNEIEQAEKKRCE